MYTIHMLCETQHYNLTETQSLIKSRKKEENYTEFETINFLWMFSEMINNGHNCRSICRKSYFTAICMIK